jgi:hypothetical protein
MESTSDAFKELYSRSHTHEMMAVYTLECKPWAEHVLRAVIFLNGAAGAYGIYRGSIFRTIIPMGAAGVTYALYKSSPLIAEIAAKHRICATRYMEMASRVYRGEAPDQFRIDNLKSLCPYVDDLIGEFDDDFPPFPLK